MDKQIEHIFKNIAPAHKAKFHLEQDELVLIVEPEQLLGLLRALRDDVSLLLSQLVSICGLDNLGEEKRFEVIYNLLSLKFNFRVRVKTNVREGESIPTAEELFKSATWYERETYDMFGVTFSGSSDPRRILTDYNFKYFPLRKDFPLTGYEEVRYDIEEKKVVYEPVQLDQEFRNFDFTSPWEGEQQGGLQDKDLSSFTKDIVTEKKEKDA
jgi:NADH-quinone oxidoreductase subunit C